MIVVVVLVVGVVVLVLVVGVGVGVVGEEVESPSNRCSKTHFLYTFNRPPAKNNPRKKL